MIEGITGFFVKLVLQQGEALPETEEELDSDAQEAVAREALQNQFDPNYPEESYPDKTSMIHGAYRQYGERKY